MAVRPRLLAGALIAATGCGPRGPSVEMAWTGADTGAATLAATATRCGAGPVALVAISGDTGIAISLYVAGEVVAGAYPVSLSAAGAALPAAAVGARWLDSTSVAAYRARGGTVTVTEAGATLGGRFSVEATQLEGPGPVTLTGSFRNIPIAPCPADTSPPGV